MRYHDTRIIGSQGEMLASVMLQTDEIFRVQLLGETVEAFDIYVEINDKTHPYPFLVQVKATDKDKRYSRNGINTPVPDEKLKWLIDRLVPTYVAGLDLRDLKMYLAPAFNMKTSYRNGIPVNHTLDLNNRNATAGVLRLLKRDVMNYWQSLNTANFKDSFLCGDKRTKEC